jgi:hypothetical protein
MLSCLHLVGRKGDSNHKARSSVFAVSSTPRHTHMHAPTHTRAHRHMHECARTLAHTHHIQSFIHTHAHIHTCTYVNVLTHAHTYIHTHAHACMHACKHRPPTVGILLQWLLSVLSLSASSCNLMLLPSALVAAPVSTSHCDPQVKRGLCLVFLGSVTRKGKHSFSFGPVCLSSDLSILSHCSRLQSIHLPPIWSSVLHHCYG